MRRRWRAAVRAVLLLSLPVSALAAGGSGPDPVRVGGLIGVCGGLLVLSLL